MNTMIQKNAGEIGRAIRNHKYEQTQNGLYIPGMRAFIGGALKVHDYRDGSEELCDIDANTLVAEGLNHILNVTMPPTGGYAQIASWYIAPYSGNYTPDGTLTAALFTATATELTGYTAGTRLPLVVGAATSTLSTGNAGAEAIMTLNAGPVNVYGGAILSASAKSNTGGKCLAAVRFASPRLAMASGDKLGYQYVLTATDAG